MAGGGEFALDPGAELGVERFAGRADEDERFEEGVVHGTGEAGGFAEAASAAGAPRVAGAMKVERGIGGGDGLAVEHDGGGVDAGEGNGGDVFRVRFEAEAVVLRGADLRELPMLSHALDADPRGFGVAKGVGLQPNFAGAGVAALGDEGFETLRELGLGGVVVFVGGVGADETFQFQALFGEGGGHEIGGFFLAVFIAGVGEGGKVEEISGNAGGLVVAPEELLPRGTRFFAGGEGLREDGGFRETRTGRSGAPEAGVVRREVPRAAATHRETGDGDAERVDGVVGADGGEGFHHVDFAGELGGVTETAVGYEGDDALGGELGRAGFALGEEGELGAFLAAAQQPNHQRRRDRRVDVEVDDEAVGLDGAVEFRAVAADDEATGLEPGSIFRAELGGAFAALGEEVFREGDFLWGIERVVGEGPRDGFVENFDVGEKRVDGGVAGEGIDLGAEGGGAGGELGAGGVGEGDALGGDFFRDGCGLGTGRESERESEGEGESSGRAHGGKSFNHRRGG